MNPSVKDWPHRYIGTPSRIHRHAGGLVLTKGAACKITGRKAGGVMIKTPDGGQWLVGPRDTEKRTA